MLSQICTRLLALIVLLFPCVVSTHAEQPSPLRILFVGNSLTYYNDLPGLLQQLVARGDDSRLEGSLLAAATILNAMGLPIIQPGEAATEVCFRKWQGSGISASQIASEQHLAKRECAPVSAERMRAITESARASFVEPDPTSETP
ncbi:MAG: hypothetical protein LAT56_17820 [Wenzhouxiangella sp.]|nr:hypothetical protein [Wenzhouxiangella sp.]